MATQTPTQMITRVQNILGNTSSAFTTHLQQSFKYVLEDLWESHDWNFKHKIENFNTAAGTELYDVASVASVTDLKSTQDIEILYDTTNKRVLNKVDYQEIRRNYPGEDQSGQPLVYAPWTTQTSIYLSPKPDAIYTIKLAYIAKATLPSTFSEDIETSLGLPSYLHSLLEKMLLVEAMLYYDDNRAEALQERIEQRLLPKAIQKDMAHFNSNERIKLWEEVLRQGNGSYNDYLSYLFSNRSNIYT